MNKIILGVAALALSLAACGEEQGDAPAPDSSPVQAGTPTCEDVWVPGATLPENYEGCMEGDSLVLAIEDSAGRVSYDDRLVAKRGGKITRSAS